MHPLTVTQFCMVMGLLCIVCTIGRRWAYITLASALLIYALFGVLDASNYPLPAPTLHLTDQKALRVV